jgi:glutathione-regulated potassium-efflux system ancillary protein KefG
VNHILILFAHPALQTSRINTVLVSAIQDLPGVTFHDLYEEYPEFDVDIKREQKLLLEHDIIIFHNPFYWYSTPAILKQWQDLVLEHGWAYGSQGKALHGKKFMNVLSTGGREIAYHKNGHNRFTIRELLAPMEQTANLCGMTFLPPFVVHATHQMGSDDIEKFAQEYRNMLIALRDDQIDLDQVNKFPRINSQLEKIIRESKGTNHAK